jgi:hypothetical protein
LAKNSSRDAQSQSCAAGGKLEDASKLQQTKQHNQKKDQGDIVSSSRSENMPLQCIASSSEVNATRESDEEYVVRQLLDRERVSTHLRGRQGSASAYVDKAIRVETGIFILASFFMIGLEEVPLRILSDRSSSLGLREFVIMMLSRLRQDASQLCSTLLFSWLFLGALHGSGAFLLRSHSSSRGNDNHRRDGNRKLPLVNAIDMTIMIAMGTKSWAPKSAVWPVCALIAIKSFLQTTRNTIPRLFRMSIQGIELVAKLFLLRTSIRAPSNDSPFLLLSTILSFVWLIWVICNPIATPCEVIMEKYHVADAGEFYTLLSYCV